MNIIKQQKNPLLYRQEILMEIQSESNPSFSEIKKELGKDEDLVVIKRINGNFGETIFSAEAFVYDSKEAKDKIERIPRRIRAKLAEEAAKAAAKVQENKEGGAAVS